MGEIAHQVVIVVGILAACFIGPVLAVGFLVLRKRRARARRRSPIGIDLLSGPGHTLREQLDDAGTDVMADVFVLMVMQVQATVTDGYRKRGGHRGFIFKN